MVDKAAPAGLAAEAADKAADKAVDKAVAGGSAAEAADEAAAPGGSATARVEEEEFQLPTTPCLGEWRDKEGMYPNLSDLFPYGNEFTLQVLDVGITDQGKPTGKVLVTDGEYYVSAKLGLEGTRRRTEYIDWLKNQRVGIYSLIRVQETNGSPSSLIIVSFNVGHSNLFSYILCQGLSFISVFLFL